MFWFNPNPFTMSSVATGMLSMVAQAQVHSMMVPSLFRLVFNSHIAPTDQMADRIHLDSWGFVLGVRKTFISSTVAGADQVMVVITVLFCGEVMVCTYGCQAVFFNGFNDSTI